MVIRNLPYDTSLVLHDGTAKTADANGSAGILDLGQGAYRGLVVLDVSAMLITDNDELYEVILEASNSATHASGVVELGRLHLGANEVINGNCDTDRSTGKHYLPFVNEVGGTEYRYVRLRFEISGTTPSITTTAFLTRYFA